MPIDISTTTVRNILTRTTGYLRTVTSHSLQPYRGCTFGNALCGVGCYVQHNGHVTRGRRWGGFLEVRTNAADSYLANREREARWAHRPAAGSGRPGRFSIFLSSSTDPFVPQEQRFGVTRSILTAMCVQPPDELIIQTHTHRAVDVLGLLTSLRSRCDLRVHMSIETDMERFPGLPPHASPVNHRLAACSKLRQSGIRTVVTVSPLLPLKNPRVFFQRIARSADAVVIDHFVRGDGTHDGRRTRRTPLPDAMRAVCPKSVDPAYREHMIDIAREFMPGRVGVNIDGFAGRFEAR